MTEILDLAKDGQYHLACAKYFEVTHNKPASKPLLHPNAYFAESRAILTEDDSNGKGKKELEKKLYDKNVLITFYLQISTTKINSLKIQLELLEVYLREKVIDFLRLLEIRISLAHQREMINSVHLQETQMQSTHL